MTVTCMSKEIEDVTYVLVLPAQGESVKAARDYTAAVWQQWDLGNSYMARVVVSELVTNALQASDPDQLILIWYTRNDDGSPVIEVADQAPAAEIAPKDSNELDTSGRGIAIINELVRTWCVLPAEDGWKTVRAELYKDGPPIP